MRTALVQCPPWGSLPPLGAAALKAYLQPHGHDVRCFDLNIDYCRERLAEALDDAGGSVYARPDPLVSGSYDEWGFEFTDGEVRFRGTLQKRPLPVERWAATVLSWDPEVVGFTIQSTNLGVSLQVAQAIVRERPEVRIVFGGPNVAQAQQGALALETGIPDAVVEGEGEETLIDLLDAFAEGRALSTVAGIGVLERGRPVWTADRPLLRDIDALPYPDFSDFDWSLYPNPYEIPLMASRGCVLKCAFCYETVYWKRYRTQHADRIVGEIEHQIANHPLRADVEAKRARFGISFADSLVNGHLGGLRRTAELLIEHQTDVYWNGQATINHKMDDDYLETLARSGCTGLSFGLESGSPLVLESMGKRFDVEEATAFFERVERAGIELVANIMVGFPTETRKDFLQTLRFLMGIRRTVYMVNNVGATGVVGGARLHTEPETFGIVPVDIAGWKTHRNLEWSSVAAGDASERARRVKVLHLWMTLLRIPHQRIGRSSRRWPRLLPKLPARHTLARLLPGLPARPKRRLDRLAAETPPAPERQPTMSRRRAESRIRKIEAKAGSTALVFEVVEDCVENVVAAPEWAEVLDPHAWVGASLLEMGGRVLALLEPPDGPQSHVGPDGVTEVRIEAADPRPAGLPGLLVHVFPPAKASGAHLVAVVPLSTACVDVPA